MIAGIADIPNRNLKSVSANRSSLHNGRYFSYFSKVKFGMTMRPGLREQANRTNFKQMRLILIKVQMAFSSEKLFISRRDKGILPVLISLLSS